MEIHRRIERENHESRECIEINTKIEKRSRRATGRVVVNKYNQHHIPYMRGDYMLNVIIYFRSEDGDRRFEDVPEEERREIIDKRLDLALAGIQFERVKSA